ncbi:MAG: hypothetical protein ABJD23_01945, partial [Nonlabens sp.]
MKNLQLGDIFEIKTQRGWAYFQVCHFDKLEGDLIKIFNHVYDNSQTDFQKIISVNDTYYYRSLLKPAYRRKLVDLVGYEDLPKGFELPRYSRSKHLVRGEFLGWFIIDHVANTQILIQELSEDQKKYSSDGIVNDT